MGLETVAVFSEADADAPHVRFSASGAGQAVAHQAVCIGPAPAAQSYLDIDKVLEAAARTGATAIHPGYGFLAENPDFVDAVAEAGLIFIGPGADAVRAMGDKASARALMAARGVPVVPGYDGEAQDEATFVAEAERIGFPLLVKASAGGGGKGMSVVESAAELPAALAGARRVAESAFGDGRLLLERYVTRPRHIEVQILGDTHGRVLHVFERECSVQRRFQKIIEETPSPAVDEALRARLCEAAIKAGEALGYVGAGTVEFILGADGEFFFLEVNTRLQVEHPVTEMITGLDLVRWQLLIALGEALPEQSEIHSNGHAIECRIYAEDAAQGFMPAVGRVVEWSAPHGAHVRVDSGVETGSEVGIHYDPMLAKVITWGPTRRESLLRMEGALRDLGVQGLTTNRAFLRAVLATPAFAAGEIDTHFVRTHLEGWAPSEALGERGLAAALWDAERSKAANPLLPGLRAGFRNNRWRGTRITHRCGEAEARVEYVALGEGRYRQGERLVSVTALEGARLVLEIEGLRQTFHVVAEGETRYVRDAAGQSVLELVPDFPEAEDEEAAGGCVAPMPGRVTQVLVTEGQPVEKGAALVVLEAMKMEQTLSASEAGTVVAVRCAEGEQVEAGAVLVELEAAEG